MSAAIAKCWHRLEYQAGQAVVWRDAVTEWFRRTSGISDASGRVGHYPGRFEAEAMHLYGYQVRDVVPAEDASGGKAVACARRRVQRLAQIRWRRPAGTRCASSISTSAMASRITAARGRTSDR